MAAEVAQAYAQVQSAAARAAEAEAERRRVAALVNYTHVRAPFDGIITQRHLSPGHFLQPSQGTGSKMEPIFTVVQIDPVRVFVDVPENDAVDVQPGDKAQVRIPALPGQEFAGTVARTSWALSPQQRTLRAEIDLPNPDGKLRPGMYVNARIAIEQSIVLTLPAAATLTQDGQSYCFCLEDGRAMRTALQTGRRAGPWVEVLKKQKRRGTSGTEAEWLELTGKEKVLQPPGTLVEGQVVTMPSQD